MTAAQPGRCSSPPHAAGLLLAWHSGSRPRTAAAVEAMVRAVARRRFKAVAPASADPLSDHASSSGERFAATMPFERERPPRHCWQRTCAGSRLGMLRGRRSYPSARITRVSGWTPSCFIASAAGSVCMNS